MVFKKYNPLLFRCTSDSYKKNDMASVPLVIWQAVAALSSDFVLETVLNSAEEQLFRPHLWGEELYTQMVFFCSDNFGRPIY